MRQASRFSDRIAELDNSTSISFYRNWHLLPSESPSHSEAPKQKLQHRKEKVAPDFLTTASSGVFFFLIVCFLVFRNIRTSNLTYLRSEGIFSVTVVQ